jgi:hypothetical protein
MMVGVTEIGYFSAMDFGTMCAMPLEKADRPTPHKTHDP